MPQNPYEKYKTEVSTLRDTVAQSDLFTETEPIIKSRKISNSEVTSWLSCKRQYSFAFLRNITPKKGNTYALDRGTLGHLAMQYYIEARIANATHVEAHRATQRAYQEALSLGLDSALILETKGIMDRFIVMNEGWPDWDFLGTEESYELEVNDSLIIPIRYDLYYFNRATGKYVIGDFKLTYNFWQPWEHDLNAQMVKYISIMNANGIKVDHGELIEIRSRSLKNPSPKDLYRYTKYYPNKTKQRAMLKQHLLASQEIIEFRELPPKQQELKALPVLNKHGACKFCNFKDLCDTMNDGGDVEVMIDADYEQNTSYGYNEENQKQLGELI